VPCHSCPTNGTAPLSTRQRPLRPRAVGESDSWAKRQVPCATTVTAPACPRPPGRLRRPGGRGQAGAGKIDAELLTELAHESDSPPRQAGWGLVCHNLCYSYDLWKIRCSKWRCPTKEPRIFCCRANSWATLLSMESARRIREEGQFAGSAPHVMDSRNSEVAICRWQCRRASESPHGCPRDSPQTNLTCP
jgi:hypothetical protein